MSALSSKIFQLITYESQLEKLKEEIVAMHHQVPGVAESDSEKVTETLKCKIQEYEELSEKYNNLFNDILQDSTRMKEEYKELKKS